MNALELEAYKAELAREVLNTNNQEVLDSIKGYHTKRWVYECSLFDGYKWSQAKITEFRGKI